MWDCVFVVKFRFEMLNEWLDVWLSKITSMAIFNCCIKYELIVSNNSSSTDVPHERRSYVASFDQTCRHPWIEPPDVSNKACLKNLTGYAFCGQLMYVHLSIQVYFSTLPAVHYDKPGKTGSIYCVFFSCMSSSMMITVRNVVYLSHAPLTSVICNLF